MRYLRHPEPRAGTSGAAHRASTKLNQQWRAVAAYSYRLEWGTLGMVGTFSGRDELRAALGVAGRGLAELREQRRRANREEDELALANWNPLHDDEMPL